MIRLAASNSPVEAAWAAFDDAAIELHRLYRAAERLPETAAARAYRMERSIRVVKLWDAWRALFLGATEPGKAG